MKIEARFRPRLQEALRNHSLPDFLHNGVVGGPEVADTPAKVNEVAR